tara:strand:+ start:7861 stop:8403 length:543 start_codon:yes stop_codon:yes gene_type:complete
MNKFNTKVSELLSEEEYKYEYSCVMCDLTDPLLLNKMKHIVDSVPYEALADYGREYESHITALYGIHTNNVDVIKGKMSDTKTPFKFKFKGLSLFENEDFDVLKFDIESEDLINLNKKLRELDYTSSYKDYKPHLTVAYVKSGMGKQLLHETILDGVETKSSRFTISLGKTNDKVVFNNG